MDSGSISPLGEASECQILLSGEFRCFFILASELSGTQVFIKLEVGESRTRVKVDHFGGPFLEALFLVFFINLALIWT